MRLDRTRLVTYLLWSTGAGIAFFSVYPTTNWVTTLRGQTYRCYFDWELSTPFVPHFIWAYLSMYVLFFTPPLFMEPPALRALGQQVIWATLISGLMFLLFPATLGFPRVVPGDPSVDEIYRTMFALDEPHNLVPSLHVVWSGGHRPGGARQRRSLGAVVLPGLAGPYRPVHFASTSTPSG